jgi:hypothetical protein
MLIMQPLKVIESEKQLTKEDINNIENKLGLKLPVEYKQFLELHNGGHPLKDFYPLIEPIWGDKVRGGNADLAWFLAIYEGEYENFERTLNTMRNRIPKDLIPIARGSGGDLVCLCTQGDNYGKVYFWDHNWEAEDGQEPTYDNVYLVANSFTDFINSLYEHKN